MKETMRNTPKKRSYLHSSVAEPNKRNPKSYLIERSLRNTPERKPLRGTGTDANLTHSSCLNEVGMKTSQVLSKKSSIVQMKLSQAIITMATRTVPYKVIFWRMFEFRFWHRLGLVHSVALWRSSEGSTN